MNLVRVGLQFIIAVSIFSAIISVQAEAILFNDGQVYVINAGNSFPFEAVIVRDRQRLVAVLRGRPRDSAPASSTHSPLIGPRATAWSFQNAHTRASGHNAS